MSDGRIFTDYRANCFMIPPKPSDTGVWSDFEFRSGFKAYGETTIQQDREKAITVVRAETRHVIDTMVPEFTKRVYDWKGGVEIIAHPAGIGTGRMFLLGNENSALITADPDVLAKETIPDSMLPGTFSVPFQYKSQQAASGTTLGFKPNRYSAPYESR